MVRAKPWNDTKVFSDSVAHAVLELLMAQQDQWKALKALHDRYKTSDSVPKLPITLSTPEMESK
eukprot:4024543-Pleurochrysis_carterae.AAC.1